MSNQDSSPRSVQTSDIDLSPSVRALSAAGAAFLSAIIMNPLDVAKTRLQAQAAGGGGPYQNLYSTYLFETNTPAQYKGTLDVFQKVIKQEGFARLWRGTNASLVLAVPTVGIYMPCYDIVRNYMEEYTTKNAPSATPVVPLVAGSVARSLACITCYPVELARTRMQAFKDGQHGTKLPGLLKTLLGVVYADKGTKILHSPFSSFRLLWTGLGAQLSRDVPFSAVCWATLEPVRRQLLRITSDESSLSTILGANFAAGLLAGSLAGAATCPLDVAKTHRQIENDRVRAITMTTRQTLAEIWRDGGMKGLFTGVVPRVARAGPSVGIVVSFYEVVKYILHNRKHQPYENQRH